MNKRLRSVSLAALLVTIVTSAAIPLLKFKTLYPAKVDSARVSLLSFATDRNDQKPLEHPYLFFQNGGVRRAQINAATTHKKIWRPIQTFTYENLSEALPEKSNREWSQTDFRNYGNQLSVFAFTCLIEESEDVCALAKETLLTMIEWEQWGNKERRDLGQAHIMIGVALAYDWLYADLTKGERDQVRATLGAWAEKMLEASQGPKVNEWGNWWRKSYAQNHHWTNNSALGMVGLALWDEDPRAKSWVDVAATELEKFQLLLNGIEDGSWHEGIHYQNYGLTMTLPFLVNLRQLRGIDLLPATYLEKYVEWRLYNYAPGSWEPLLSYGDYNFDWGNGYHPSNILRFAAAEYQDGSAEWLAQQLAEDGGRRPSVWSAPWQLFEFFYYDPAVVSRSPSALSESKFFPDIDAVVWRTGWQKSDLQFSLRSGAYGGRYIYETFTTGQPPWEVPCTETRCELNFSHDHDDALNFTIRRGNEWLMPETEGNGKRDTAYHNTLLVDGKGQYRPPDDKYRHADEIAGTDGLITQVVDLPDFKYLSADATRRYKHFDDIENVTRQVLYLQPDYFLMLDQIVAKEAHTFTWIGHFAGDVKQNENWVWSQSESGQRIGVNSIASKGLQIAIGNDGRPYMQNQTIGKETAVRFLHLIYPTDVKQSQSTPTATLLTDTGSSVTVQIHQNTKVARVDTVIINYAKEAAMMSAPEAPFLFDGHSALITREAERLRKVSMVGGIELINNIDGIRMIEKNNPNSSIDVTLIGKTAIVVADGADQVRLFAPDIEQLVVNGTQQTFERDNEYVLFEISLD